MGAEITEAESAAFHDVVGRLRALPVDDPVRLRAEQVAASFARDGRLRRCKARGAQVSAADAAAMAATATGALDRREDAPLTDDVRHGAEAVGSAESTGRAPGREPVASPGTGTPAPWASTAGPAA